MQIWQSGNEFSHQSTYIEVIKWETLKNHQNEEISEIEQNGL